MFRYVIFTVVVAVIIVSDLPMVSAQDNFNGTTEGNLDDEMPVIPNGEPERQSQESTTEDWGAKNQDKSSADSDGGFKTSDTPVDGSTTTEDENKTDDPESTTTYISYTSTFGSTATETENSSSTDSDTNNNGFSKGTDNGATPSESESKIPESSKTTTMGAVNDGSGTTRETGDFGKDGTGSVGENENDSVNESANGRLPAKSTTVASTITNTQGASSSTTSLMNPSSTPIPNQMSLNVIVDKAVNKNLDIEGPNSLKLDDRPIRYRLGRMNITIQLEDIVVIGLNNFKVDKIVSNVDNLTIDLALRAPEIIIECYYDASGSINALRNDQVDFLSRSFPTEANGNITMTLENTLVNGTIYLLISYNDLKLAIEKIDLSYQFQTPTISVFENKFPSVLLKLFFRRMLKEQIGKLVTQTLNVQITTQMEVALWDSISKSLDKIPLYPEGLELQWVKMNEDTTVSAPA